MAITQIRGNTQIKDASINTGKLATESNATWVVSPDNTGVIDGLANPTGSNQAVTKNYVDGLINSSLKAPDSFETTSNGDYPSDYKGTGQVEEGDTFYITDISNGNAVGSKIVNVGDLLVALVNDPGNTDDNWVIMESNRDQATETVKGVARIATSSEVSAGTDDTTIVTPLKLKQVEKQAGAGLVDNSGTFDVVAADASLIVNADDMAVQIGTDNGTSLEVSTTGLELTSTITGTRTFSAGGGNKITLDTDANLSVLTNQPDGTDSLSISTTGYVDNTLNNAINNEIFSELPAVTADSTDVTLANTPVSGTERVYLNGVRQVPGSGNDYTISDSTISFANALQSEDVVLVDYRKA